MLFSLDTRKGEFLIMAALSFLKSEEVEFFRTNTGAAILVQQYRLSFLQIIMIS